MFELRPQHIAADDAQQFGGLHLNEPFGALDAFTRAYLQEELQHIWEKEGITMILVTHDVEEAVYLGGRVVVMQPHPGRIKRIIDVLAGTRAQPLQRSIRRNQGRSATGVQHYT